MRLYSKEWYEAKIARLRSLSQLKDRAALAARIKEATDGTAKPWVLENGRLSKVISAMERRDRLNKLEIKRLKLELNNLRLQISDAPLPSRFETERMPWPKEYSPR